MNTHKLAIGIIREVSLGKREAWDVLCLVAEHEPDALCRSLGISIPSGFSRAGATAPGWVEEARQFVAAGNLVEAIKHVRTHRGFGLKGAKDVVDYSKQFTNDEQCREALATWVPPPANSSIPF
jgi:hypothetical protein